MSNESVTVIGVRADGSEAVLGTANMPAGMKRKEIASEQFGPLSADESGNEADICLWALEQYHDWLVQQGWTGPKLSITPVGEANP